MFESLPAQVKSALGINVDIMLSFLGFFAFTFTNITLAAAIYAAYSGVMQLSREPRAKVTDFLLTKPRTRSSLFRQKLTAGLGTLTVVWVVFTVTSFVFAKLFGAGDFSLQNFIILMLALYVVMMWFFSCGLFISQIVRRVKAPLSITLAVVFGFFLVGMVGAIMDEPKVRYLSPFRFFDYVSIVAGNAVELRYMVLSLVTILVMVASSYFIYTKRDVAAAV